MSTLSNLFEDYNEMIEEIYSLRNENKKLRETCEELYEFFRESTKPNPDFYSLPPENPVPLGAGMNGGKL